jgi:three-Cys-motif partner protein
MKPRASVMASDGLIARDSGDWAQFKLEFLQEYGPVACDATATKLQRYFIDLFAGPGLNVGRESKKEFDGSSLCAMQLKGKRAAFTHLIACNDKKDQHDALTLRVDRCVAAAKSHITRANIKLIHGNTASHLSSILSSIHPKAYALVFADIEGIQEWPFHLVEKLRGAGHASIDLCMLFPLEMTINRLLSYNKEHTEKYASLVTNFFGTDKWKPILGSRITDGQADECRQRLIELYDAQLRKHFAHVMQVRDVKRRGDQTLYRLLFASDSDAGKRIAEWARGVQEKSRQLDFRFD